MNFDRDRSGTVESHELQQALVSFGYNLSPQAIGCILRRYGTDGKIGFDDFVSCAVKIRSLTCKCAYHTASIYMAPVILVHCIYIYIHVYVLKTCPYLLFLLQLNSSGVMFSAMELLPSDTMNSFRWQCLSKEQHTPRNW